MAIIGIIVVTVAVIGGFLMAKGNLSVLFHLSEIVTIGGTAIGAFIIASPPKVAKHVVGSLANIFSMKSHGKDHYVELLSLLYKIFSKIRKEGLISIEADIEHPDKSALFRRFPSVVKEKRLMNFICDNLKVIVTTSIPPHELDGLLDIEIDIGLHEAQLPSHALSTVADSLPGIGIVAAVLGIVITMGKINEPPEILGASIGAALVGTFLGILLCYGFVGPMAANLNYKAKEEEVSFHVIKLAIVAFVGGSAPQIAVEFGRRAIPDHDKPSFSELEKAVRAASK